jgi:hypothetical protein
VERKVGGGREKLPWVVGTEAGIRGVAGAERGLARGLEIGGLRLDRTNKGSFRVVEVVLVVQVVLGRGSVEPGGALRLDEHAARVVDVDLGAQVDVVIGHPDPYLRIG